MHADFKNYSTDILVAVPLNVSGIRYEMMESVLFNLSFKFGVFSQKFFLYYPTFSVKRLYQILYGIGKPEMKYEKTESANAIYLTYRLSITVHGICATYNKILSYNNLSYFSHHPTLSLTKSYCP